MKLNRQELLDKMIWKEAKIKLPEFDFEKVANHTFEKPVWVHFGPGNIFRAFPALAQQKLLESGLCESGIVAAFPIEAEIIDKLWKPCDNLSLLVTLKADGKIEKTVVGSVTEALNADEECTSDWSRLVDIFKNPSLQMVSFTITEKGYADLSENSAMTKVTKLCYERFLAGAMPLALVSMDNCSENGTKLREAVVKSAENLDYDKAFKSYINDSKRVGFPWTMIDKITPRPDAHVKLMLFKDGFENAETIVTDKGTYASAFVNAEETEYLVIEDAFPNGRPALEKAGFIFTNRKTVMKAEKMKVCTCLNPIHTALAVLGCLLSFGLISEEMKDADLKKFVRKLGFNEGMPAVVNPGIIDPEEFLTEVLETRLPNPFLPDTPQRIATDTSQKIPVRFGETIRIYKESKDLDVDSLELIPFVFAAWCRYLTGIDDYGDYFDLSPDPMLGELTACFIEFKHEGGNNVHEMLEPILSREDLFGINLYETKLGEKTEAYFAEMSNGRGAVRDALQKVLQNN